MILAFYSLFIWQYQKQKQSLPPHIQKNQNTRKEGGNDFFTVYDLNLKTISLASLKNKVVILNFWATWCAPCIKEIPSLNALAGHFPKKLTILLVSNERTDTIKNFLMIFPNFHSNFIPSNVSKKEMVRTFNVSAFPETYILNKKGQLTQKIIGPEKWDSKIWKQKIQNLISEK